MKPYCEHLKEIHTRHYYTSNIYYKRVSYKSMALLLNMSIVNVKCYIKLQN